ncbi:hypothetical protein SO802_021928 [Lithocarpus litseifolius]|uniref:FAR1 domain-containing protein n=1 Tax=Lithocarpus litseifolius TaxID=425828 RepID=A0AAW2CGG6_9ROSI
MKLRDIQDVHKKFTQNRSAGTANKAREKAREYIDGAYTQQYNQLWEYYEEFRMASPSNTILMKVHTFNEGDLAVKMDLVYRVPYFERLYICLEGCKKGFLTGCRPIIGLDVYHLKTKSGGQLITAIARHPNEEYFPLAYAIVEGLVQTFIDNQPQYEHRICYRHLYNNFKKNHLGVLIKNLFWKAVKATYKTKFDRVMDELKEIDEDAHNWLCSPGAPPQPWTSSSSPFAPDQTNMHSSSSPSAPYQYTMHSFTPSAPFQSWEIVDLERAIDYGGDKERVVVVAVIAQIGLGLMDTEPLAEDKNVIADSSIGGESGIYEVDANQEPYEGMLFESEEAAKAFYDEYAKRLGFLTRIVSSRKSERDGSIISRRLACNKEGFNVNSQRRGQVRIRKRESKREGCMAMFLVKREKPGRWVVTKFVRDHNHPLVICSEKGRPTPDEKDRRIRELSSELHRANQHLASCREQLHTFMTYVEEHTECLSRTVEDVVHRIREVESEDPKPSQYS